MQDKNLSRRQILGGVAVTAGTAGLLGALDTRAALAAEPAASGPVFPDQGAHQAPPITDVRGKVAYVTGGSSGIGLGIARALHEAGAKVILGNYNDQQFADALKEFPANDPRVATMVHDVMVRELWEQKANEIEKIFGPVQILVNNAGVGPFATTTGGTDKDWDWCMGVNFWGPTYGVRTFVPRMLARKDDGCHIVTTSSTDGVLLGTTGIYAVSKMAVSGLMEQLRHELRNSNIGTSNLVPGMTSTNIARSETYRPEELKNEAVAGAPAGGPPRGPGGARPPGAGGAPGAAATPPTPVSPLWQRPQQPLDVGRMVVNGIINNDMWIFPAPEYRMGVLARGYAMYESMVDFTPMPANIAAGLNRNFRTPIYVQEVAHRRATTKRNITGF